MTAQCVIALYTSLNRCSKMTIAFPFGRLRQPPSTEEGAPNTLVAATNRANTLLHLGQYIECERIYRETLVLQKEVFGAEHEHTKATTINLQGLIDSGHASIQTMPV